MSKVKVVPRNGVIFFYLRNHVIYDIALADFVKDSEHWIRQLNGKSWMNSRIMAEVMDIVIKHKLGNL